MLPPVAELEERVAALMRHWRVPGPRAMVCWNDRLRSTAGRAFGRQGRIELNPALLGHRKRELHVVLVHEAAHLAAHRLYGPSVAPHGRHWRALMRLCGLPPAITHDLPLPPSRRRRRHHLFLRVCDACGDRRIARAVRYRACACGAERFLVLRAPASEGGLAALRRLRLHEVRRRCIMAERP